MSTSLSVSGRLNGILRALEVEAEDLRAVGCEQDALAMDHYRRMISDIQRQALDEEIERGDAK
ncbi:MAG: hypothetical protein ACTH3D_09415 [Halomonas sp.]|uniref:hypothetical protein n=1 Tax=Halomonas sp. TaxID=1486246 RepID=UPI003F90B2F5